MRFLTWDFGFKVKRWLQDELVVQAPVIYGLRPTVEWCITATTGTRPKICTGSCLCSVL